MFILGTHPLRILKSRDKRRHVTQNGDNITLWLNFYACWPTTFLNSKERTLNATQSTARSVAEYDVTDASCNDTFQLNSKCYKVHKNETVNWFNAVNRCLSYNASLAVFDDNVRQYFPSSVLSVSAQGFIGLVKSRWTWPSLSQLKLDSLSFVN